MDDARPKYRSELGIIADILDAIASSGRQGINVSAVSRIANVSYNTINQKCQKLASVGFVESQRIVTRQYTLSHHQASSFLERLRGFTETIRSMNIRC